MQLNRGDELEVLRAQVDAVDEWRAGRAYLVDDPEAVQERQRLGLEDVRREGVARKAGLLHERDLDAPACEQRRQRRPRAARTHDDHIEFLAHASSDLWSLRGLASLLPRLTGRGSWYIGEMAYSSRQQWRIRCQCCRLERSWVLQLICRCVCQVGVLDRTGVCRRWGCGCWVGAPGSVSALPV